MTLVKKHVIVVYLQQVYEKSRHKSNISNGIYCILNGISPYVDLGGTGEAFRDLFHRQSLV